MERSIKMSDSEGVVILIAEDDEGHTTLIIKNLKRAGLANPIITFKDGSEILDFLMYRGDAPHRLRGTHYLLLLDIRMPKVDGIEVLRQLKKDEELCKMPVIILTTTDDPREVDECYKLGCSSYITKPVDYEEFVEVIKKLGLFLLVVKVPKIYGGTDHGEKETKK
jgi:CheY-like chemotaxis protein